MSDNDLIRRGDAKGHPFANGMYDREHADKKFISGHECYKEWLDTVPAVPQEMTAREFLEIEARMSRYYGLPCMFDVYGVAFDEEINMVEEWAKKHPERSEDDGDI